MLDQAEQGGRFAGEKVVVQSRGWRVSSMASPTAPGRLQTPADGLQVASDAQSIFFGQLTQRYGSPAPGTASVTGWKGPVGYVIE